MLYKVTKVKNNRKLLNCFYLIVLYVFLLVGAVKISISGTKESQMRDQAIVMLKSSPVQKDEKYLK